MNTTYSLLFESNDGDVILQASGMTKEQAERMAETEAALSIDELNGRYVVKAEVQIRGQRYILPEGFSMRKPRVGGIEIDDETGRACGLYYHGYTSKVGDDQPYITTSAQSGSRRIPLQKLGE